MCMVCIYIAHVHGAQEGTSDMGKEKLHGRCGHRKEVRKRPFTKSNGFRLVKARPNCPNTGMASTGVVVRDKSGNVLLSAWRTLNNIASAEEAEALACRGYT
jgi:hypothetical protein